MKHVLTFAMRLHGAFGPFIAPAFGPTLADARRNLARELGHNPETFAPVCVATFDELADFYAAQDRGELS